MIPILYKRIGTASKNFEATAKKSHFLDKSMSLSDPPQECDCWKAFS